MKDYPEAQDILQTLGRKRLQEAKSMSRQKVKSMNCYLKQTFMFIQLQKLIFNLCFR